MPRVSIVAVVLRCVVLDAVCVAVLLDVWREAGPPEGRDLGESAGAGLLVMAAVVTAVLLWSVVDGFLVDVATAAVRWAVVGVALGIAWAATIVVTGGRLTAGRIDAVQVVGGVPLMFALVAVGAGIGVLTGTVARRAWEGLRALLVGSARAPRNR